MSTGCDWGPSLSEFAVGILSSFPVCVARAPRTIRTIVSIEAFVGQVTVQWKNFPPMVHAHSQPDGHLVQYVFVSYDSHSRTSPATHLAACTMYVLAKWKHFGPDTWIGSHGDTMDHPYIRSLWLSVVAFMTVGFGDYSAVNATEMVVMMSFMMVNIVVASWFIGSITLLVVKGDEKTGEYRDSLETLQQYSELHEFEDEFAEGLKRQLRLDFSNREIADEQVLKNFPSAVRRKILRKLYLGHLENTQLLKGIRPQFVDAFLTSCTVEIFSPGECIIDRGSILSDLFLLVGGIAETTSSLSPLASHHGPSENSTQFEEGTFMGAIGFFT